MIVLYIIYGLTSYINDSEIAYYCDIWLWYFDTNKTIFSRKAIEVYINDYGLNKWIAVHIKVSQ